MICRQKVFPSEDTPAYSVAVSVTEGKKLGTVGSTSFIRLAPNAPLGQAPVFLTSACLKILTNNRRPSLFILTMSDKGKMFK